MSDTSSPTRPAEHRPPPVQPPPDTPPPAWESPTGRPPPSQGSAVGWGVALIAIGGLWLARQLGLPVVWELVLPGALVVVGALLLLRPQLAQRGLIGLGVVLLVLTVLTVLVPRATSGTTGDRNHVVTTPAELADVYELGAGSLVLDLRALDLIEDTAVRARVGMGELIVIVPEDVQLAGQARVGLGEVSRFGEDTGGVAPSVDLADDGSPDGPVLELDLQVGMGQLEVRR